MYVAIYYTIKGSPDVKLSDGNSKLYIYYGRYTTDLIDYTFQDGTFTKGEETILPDHNVVIEKGEIILSLYKIDKPFTVVVESCFYKKTTAWSYSAGKENISITFVFNP